MIFFFSKLITNYDETVSGRKKKKKEPKPFPLKKENFWKLEYRTLNKKQNGSLKIPTNYFSVLIFVRCFYIFASLRENICKLKFC